MNLIGKLLLCSMLFLTSLVASEQNPTEEEVAKLYVATFNRAPDSAGLSYWINNSGLTLSEIAKSFFVQTETRALYPEGTTVRAFIQSVYQNLFNRAPDSGGLKYWEDDFNLRGRTRDSFILAMINGAKDNADGMDKTILNNKNEVGLYFANAGLGENDSPTEVMSGVTADSNTVEFIKGIIHGGSIGQNMWDSFIASNTISTEIPDDSPINDYYGNSVAFSDVQNGMTLYIDCVLVSTNEVVRLSFNGPMSEYVLGFNEGFGSFNPVSVSDSELATYNYSASATSVPVTAKIANLNGGVRYDNFNILSSTNSFKTGTNLMIGSHSCHVYHVLSSQELADNLNDIADLIGQL